ncbi:MAG TPA: hypothetical protein V6C91_07865, partial [Coleofasciculaceae cyanobacterium]
VGCEKKVNLRKPNNNLTAEKLDEYEAEATVKFSKLPTPEVISENVKLYRISLPVRELGNMTFGNLLDEKTIMLIGKIKTELVS